MSEEKLNIIDKLKNLDILNMSRRTFMKTIVAMGATGFVHSYGSTLAKAISFSKTKVLWLHGAECTGCSEAALNASSPEFAEALEKLNISIDYHETLLAQQGIFVNGEKANTSELNAEILMDELIDQGNYILVVEGSIGNGPQGTGKVCMYGGHTFKSIFEKAAKNSIAIIALGTCASYGGITVADSATKSYCDFHGVSNTEGKDGGMLKILNINKPCINIPGCPSHPDWFFLTVAALLLGKIDLENLESYLDKDKRLKAFFPPDHTLHDNCPRRGFYDRGILDKEISKGGCLWKLGCKAPYVHSDCALRKWNNGTSLCMQVGAPCIGCVEPGFPNTTTPFFEESEKTEILFGTNVGKVSGLAIGAAVAAAGIHAVRRMKKEEE